MKIFRVELTQRREFRPRADEQLARPVISGFGLSQRLQVAIGAHQRHPEHFAELGLCERQRTSVVLHEPGEFGPIELLAKEMRDPRRAMTAAVVGDALAEDRRVYQRFSPNGESYRGALREHFHQLFVGNGANQSASHRADRMIHLLKKKSLGVRPVTRIVKREVLSGTRP